jgi:hypothetical protein
VINHLLYIVGAPGVGKSTLARTLTEGWDREVLRSAPVPHSRLRHPATGRLIGLELGVPRPDFPGTDTLAMDISPRALQFLTGQCVPFALCEGSRLATRPFLGELARSGVSILLVSLTADEELLEQRWRDRGAKQNPTWRKGAATRAERITEWFSEGMSSFPGRCTLLDLDVTEATPAGLADTVLDRFPLLDLRESPA